MPGFQKHAAPGGQMRILEWTLAAGENGDAFRLPSEADRSVQVIGSVFGTTVTIQGSNVPTPTLDAHWFTLHDSVGDTLAFTAVGGDAIMENTLWVRAITTGGDSGGTTAVTVYMSGRHSK